MTSGVLHAQRPPRKRLRPNAHATSDVDDSTESWATAKLSRNGVRGDHTRAALNNIAFPLSGLLARNNFRLRRHSGGTSASIGECPYPAGHGGLGEATGWPDGRRMESAR